MIKKYEKYKNSGVEWIDEIPADWTVSQYKFAAFVQNGFAFKSNLFDKNEGFPILRIRDITNGKISTFYKGDYDEQYIVRKDDLLIGMDGDYNIRWWNNKEAILNQRCCRIIEKDGISKRFLYYILPFSLEIINDLTYYTTVKHLSSGDIYNAKLPFPTPKEQTKIAEYLDHQTGLIDKILEKKRLLIEKLKEQRQAIINEAVTKGLNPNAPMKYSGVEWLGEIPEKWEICKLKHIAELKSGNFISADNIDPTGEFPVYGGNGLRGYTNSFTHNGNYVLIGRQGAHCGNIKYAERKFWATEHAVVVTLKKDSDTFFIGELLRTMNLNQYNESAAQPGLAVGKIMNLWIPKIPYQDQIEISDFIIREVGITSEVISKSENQILKLEGYRKSLISEVVTGKIDVREWQVKVKETA